MPYPIAGVRLRTICPTSALGLEIGRELNLAEVTVKLHLGGVFRKIGVRNRAEAAVLAAQAGL